MPRRTARPSITTLTFSQWLAGGLEISVRPATGSSGAPSRLGTQVATEVAAELGTNLPGCWVQQRWTHVSITPRWIDPNDVGERIGQACTIEQVLYERLNGRIIGLADWAVAPLREAGPAGDEKWQRQAYYDAIHAARQPVLEPYLAGRRKIRGAALDAFRAFHTALDDVSELILRQSRYLNYQAQPVQPSSRQYDSTELDAGINSLLKLGLVSLGPAPKPVRQPAPGTHYASRTIMAAASFVALHPDDLLRVP